jgi:hypothetical protein
VLPVGYRYEIEVVIDRVQLRPTADMGVFIHSLEDPRDMNWRLCSVEQVTPQLLLGVRVVATDRIAAKIPGPRASFSRVCTMRLQVWDEEVVCRLGDAVIFAGTMPRDRRGTAPFFGLGSGSHYRAGFGRYSGLRVRRLDHRPEELP